MAVDGRAGASSRRSPIARDKARRVVRPPHPNGGCARGLRERTRSAAPHLERSVRRKRAPSAQPERSLGASAKFADVEGRQAVAPDGEAAEPVLTGSLRCAGGLHLRSGTAEALGQWRQMRAKPDDVRVESGGDLLLAVSFVKGRMLEAITDLEAVAHGAQAFGAECLELVAVHRPAQVA